MTSMTLHRRGLLIGALALPGLARAEPPAGPFRFNGPGGVQTDAERGYFDVPEDRTDPASRHIRLGYVRFRSRAARPGPPIVYLAGGPGGAGTVAAAGPRFALFEALRDVADVIAFDQRGTGLSTAIPPAPAPVGPPPPLTREGLTTHFRRELPRAWAAWTAQGISMGGYDTAQSADDVDALRRHLGAQVIDLWGISYGTHLALCVLRRHGSRVRRVALASLEGQDQTVKLPSSLDAYFDRIDTLLASDARCRAAVPDLPALMRRVHARLEAEPAPVAVRLHGAAGEVRVGGFAVQIIAGGLVANPSGLALLPSLYLALEAGRANVLAPYLGDVAGLLAVSGMPEAMDLASGISPGRLARVEREARTAVLGDSLNFPVPHLLGTIPSIDLGARFRSPLRIEAPALLVAGSLDGRTPLSEQAQVARQFQNATRIVVENAGHNVWEAHPEMRSLLLDFFTGRPPATTSLKLPPPQFRIG